MINDEECKQLVGIGTDSASANVAAGGLKGLMEEKLPWIFWMWCLAHRFKLSVKSALKGTSFDQINEMLYYVYETSPKKCQQLEDVTGELKQCVEF